MKLFQPLSWIAISALLLYGCNAFEQIGDSKSEEACRYEVSRALDKQEYDRAEELLNGECYGAFSDAERYINLGAVYLGRAGYSLPSLISDILESNTDTNTVNQDSFSRYISKLATRSGGQKVLWIERAREYYQKALETLGANLDCQNPVGQLEKDACFFKGIADFSQATSSFVTLFETVTGEKSTVEEAIKAWANDETNLSCDIDADKNGVVDSAQFTACALEYAVNGNITESRCNLEDEILGNFGHEGKNFKVIRLSIQADTSCGGGTKYDYKVLEVLNGSDVLTLVRTDSFCNINTGEQCKTLDESNGCFPCPLVTEKDGGEETLTVVGSLISLINEGAETILNTVEYSGDEYSQSDLEEALIEFRKDLCKEHFENCECCDNNECNDSDWRECSSDLDVENALNVRLKNDSVSAQELLKDYLQ